MDVVDVPFLAVGVAEPPLTIQGHKLMLLDGNCPVSIDGSDLAESLHAIADYDGKAGSYDGALTVQEVHGTVVESPDG